MKKSLAMFLALSACLFTFSRVSFAKDQKAHEYVLCKNQNEVRSLSVTVADDKSCVARYTKLGTDEVIAQSKTQELCHSRVRQIQNVLTSANYNCKNFANAQLMVSPEVVQ